MVCCCGIEYCVQVFTYGLDLFFTRLTPSQAFDQLNEGMHCYRWLFILTCFSASDFNHPLLIGEFCVFFLHVSFCLFAATVAGLLVALVITQRWAAHKKLAAEWK